MTAESRRSRVHANEDPYMYTRGVNIGGWLVLERFITPYMFAITSCHLEGNFCSYPGQIDVPVPVPPENNLHVEPCNLYHCTPHRFPSVAGKIDYPVDEYRLMESFENKEIARRYLDQHYDNFVTQQDITKLKQAGVTHVRVPLPFWILGDITTDEPYVQANAWKYFARLVHWCRKANIKVWPDLHTAPGSQNGFDNSGQLLEGYPTCQHWSASPTNVNRTLSILESIATQIKKDGLDDVVTGLGVLNEPFLDCNVTVVRQYNQQARDMIRTVMGQDTHIYIADLFNSTYWNDGSWWATEDEYKNTYLDSHYYHVFAEEPRALTPRQHIAYVCRKNYRDTVACCYQDPPNNTVPVKGIKRIIGEWSASFDTLVSAKLDDVMDSIAANGTALELNREIPKARRDFMRHFVKAQMVAYEANDVGVSAGWFFWTLKMEGGAFAEWDFLRGLEEGWMPHIPEPHVASEHLYGTCEDILLQTKDTMDIVHEFPDPSTLDPNNWQGVQIDDDLVVTHGASIQSTSTTLQHSFYWFPLLVACFFAYGIKKVFCNKDQKMDGYQSIGNSV